MGLEVVNVTDRGEFRKLQLTHSTGGFTNARITHYQTATITGLNTGHEVLWQNTEIVPILIFRIVVNITTPSGVGATTIEIGSDADGTGMTGEISIDELDDTATGWFDNCFGPATAVTPTLYLDENGGALDYVTCLYNGDSTNTEGTVYIFYFPLL